MSVALRGSLAMLLAALACSDATRIPGPDGNPGGVRAALSGPAPGTVINLQSRVAANRCMDVNGASRSAGARLISYSCHTGANQQFTWDASGQIKVYGTLCVSSTGTGAPGENLVTQACDGSARQRWEATSDAQLRNAAGSCAAVAGGSTALAAQLVTATCAATLAQQWNERIVSGGTTPTPAPVARVDVTPAGDTLLVGESVQLSAVARDASGATVGAASFGWASSSPSVASVSSSGVVSALAAGTARIIATSGSAADTSEILVTASSGGGGGGPLATECASPRAGWIWCDDFEQDRLASYFEVDRAGGSLAIAPDVGVGGSRALRARFAARQVNAGNLKLAFGRTPSSTFRPVDAGTANYREIYWRQYLFTPASWSGGAGDKLSRAMILAGGNWSQAMIAHVWGASNGSEYLMIDPASGTDAAGNPRTSGYNDFANLRWLGNRRASMTTFATADLGKWHCIESRVRLNDAGSSNGIFQLWIDGVLATGRTDLNWVGSYSAYGINAVFFENYWNAGSPVAQERYFDNIVVSTQPIGCGDATQGPPPPPPAPPAPVESISLTPTSVSLAPGGSTQLQATPRDASGNALSGRTIDWTSGNTSVATVSNGLVRAVGVGTTTVTASSEGRSASASVTVADAPVATVAVSPASFSLAPETTRQLSAIVRDANGNTLTGRTVTWNSESPAVATVSSGGLVRGVAPGTARIVATSEGRSGAASVTVTEAAPPPPPPTTEPSACGNEPTGLTVLANEPWNTSTPAGWNYDRNAERVSVVSDPAAPSSPSNVAAGLFPAGWDGGRSPFRVDRPFGRTYTTIYQCVWLKHSTNFTDNGNAGTKVSFFRGSGTNHYWAFDGGSGTDDGFYFFFGLQAGAGNRDFRSSYSAKPLGVWRKYEILVVGNTPGQANGQLRVWVNGQPIITATDVAYWSATQTPGWHGIAWDPTYGGGLNRVPHDMYQYVDNWYVSGR